MYPDLHEYLRTSGVPVLAVWGRGDEIFGPAGAEAFAQDAVDAEIHVLDGGHFLLESAGLEIAALVEDFLGRRLPVLGTARDAMTGNAKEMTRIGERS